MIPYGRHQVDQQDIDAVVDVLENRFLTQGALVPKFEFALCDYTGSTFATAVNSATSGLHVACLAAGVTQGDVVWTVPNSFVASANCALYCGAKIGFIDIDRQTRNIDIDALAEKLRVAANTNTLPKALIIVHFSGLSCDLRRIYSLTRKFSVTLIEDAAHALGGEYLGSKVGCCEYSDMTVLSFHPVKSITSAEGGAVLTNHNDLHSRIKLFANHGVTRDPQHMEGESHGPWYYQQVALGYNYRLSDLHAALGLSQLSKLDGFISKRTQLAQRYQIQLADLPITLPASVDYATSAWHLYMIELTQHSRQQVYIQLQERGVGVNVHYIPIHLHPYYQRLGFEKGEFPNSEQFYNCALTLPLYPSLTFDEQDVVINSLREILR
ncbi:MAG: UDP-4-amino-4,6-dideoxy-N-acetyl-beta-L-altrosamine transaminase [Paraglaciecola sp.]|uniref:UDP-4-amino-4, 6-dideoxy-N-acetyl-beta-L-altrosamine transaminase n=1 Tax=Paraglaciecola sp. TaxID=1920173 RepID=UPI003296F722